jgi:hypothetical protein
VQREAFPTYTQSAGIPTLPVRAWTTLSGASPGSILFKWVYSKWVGRGRSCTCPGHPQGAPLQPILNAPFSNSAIARFVGATLAVAPTNRAYLNGIESRMTLLAPGTGQGSGPGYAWCPFTELILTTYRYLCAPKVRVSHVKGY